MNIVSQGGGEAQKSSNFQHRPSASLLTSETRFPPMNYDILRRKKILHKAVQGERLHLGALIVPLQDFSIPLHPFAAH